ncbi:hypothetical protein ACFL4G_09195 [Thermodesulfobacteriota bacterium]
MTSRARSLLVVLTIFWFASSVGCILRRDEVRIGPLFSLSRQESTGRAVVEVLGPLFLYERSPTSRHLAFRPIFDWTAESTGERRLLFLWPLGLFETEPRKTHFRLFPLVSYKTRIKGSREIRDTDFMLLPFLFTGRDTEEGFYFALFPLAGHLKGFLGKEDLRFFLFPLYSDSRKGDHRAWNFLYPMFHRSRGGSKSAFRIWPLAGRKKMCGRYDKRFFLWPLVTYERKYFGERPPMRSLFILPIYGHKETLFGTTRHFLIPIFSRTRETRPEGTFYEWNAPWPVVCSGSGPGYRKLTFWPLMWYRRRVDGRSLVAPFPIYWQSDRMRGEENVRRRWLVPFFWSTRKTCEGESEGAKTTRLWPILDFRRGYDGASDLSVLAPLWFRDPGGFERVYGPFWTLYRRRVYPDGARSMQILWHHIGGRAWVDDNPETGTEKPGGSVTIPWSLPGPFPESEAEEE